MQYDGRIYQLIGFTAANAWGANEGPLTSSLTSFARLSDPRRIQVEPKRLSIIDLNQGMSIDRFDQRYPSTVPLKTLALINQVDEGGQLPGGALVKRVVGNIGR